jgi:uncharacterized membrane protein
MARDQVSGSAPGLVGDADATGQPAAPAGHRADLVPWLIAAAVFAVYATISGYRYLRLQSTSWDMGIFTEYVKRYAHLQAPIVDARAPGMNLLGDHFHPVVAVLAPFFRLFPSPLTLLVGQALLVAMSVIPVSRAAQELLGTGAGRVIAVAYGLSWGLQQMVDNDFHEIAFAVPLLAFSLSALVRGRVRAAVLWALPLVLVKEDQGFTVAAIGLLIAFGYRHRIAGLALAAWGLAWSLLAITVIIPHFSPTHTYLYLSLGGNLSRPGHRASVTGLLHQVFTASDVKLPTLVMILLPTAFLALRSPIVLAVLPSLALRFIATNSAYWSTQWHYNATVMPIVFIAAIDGMSWIRAARTAGGTEMSAAPAVSGTAARTEMNCGPAATQTAGGTETSAGPASTRTAAGTGIGRPHGARPAGARRRTGQDASRWARKVADQAERHGAAMMLAICAALAFQFPLGSLWSPQTYQLGPHVTAARAAMALVPNGSTVATDIDLLAPLGARADAFWLGNATTWLGHGGNPATQYVVYDDTAADLPAPSGTALSYVESLSRGVRYRQIYQQNGIFVFVRS